jgi:Effector protein
MHPLLNHTPTHFNSNNHNISFNYEKKDYFIKKSSEAFKKNQFSKDKQSILDENSDAFNLMQEIKKNLITYPDENKNFTFFSKNICIQNNSSVCPDFENVVRKNLQSINSTETGKRLIEKIDQSKHQVKISYFVKTSCLQLGSKTDPSKRGKGCDSWILFTGSAKDKIDIHLKRLETPSFIDLAHELIHACHNSYGKNAKEEEYPSIDKGFWTNPEEYKTIFGFENTKITENRIRKEHGLQERFSHYCYPE